MNNYTVHRYELSTARRLFIGALLLLCMVLTGEKNLYGQDVLYWRSESTTGDWQFGIDCGTADPSDHWWNFTDTRTEWRPDCGANANILIFNNGVQQNMNLNAGSDYTVNQMIFNPGTGSRIISSDNSRNLYFYNRSGIDATIESNSPLTTHEFNVNINIEDITTWMQIRVNDGYLQFNNTVVNNSENTLNLRGINGMRIIFNGPLMSSAGTPGVAIADEIAPGQNVRVIYQGPANSATYSGPTTLYSGATLQISSNQTLGDFILNPGATLIVDAGVTLTITGSWTGGGTIENNGTIVLAGTAAQSFPGLGTTVANMNNLTINNANGVSLNNTLPVNGTLTLTSGRLNLGAFNLTLGTTSPAVAGTLGVNNMIVADGVGLLRKSYSTNGSYVFPVGDATGVAEYSPVTLNFTSGTYAGGAYAAVRVTDAKHPNNANTNDFLTRYWTVTSSGITAFNASVSGTFVPTAADINGATANMITGKWDGSLPWQKFGAVGANTVTAAGVTSFSDFTGITAAPPTVTITANPSLTVCQNEPLTLTANPSGDAPFTYAWNTGATTQSIPPSTAIVGSIVYTVTVTDANGFTASANVTVNVLAPQTVTCPANSSTCINSADLPLAGGSPSGGIYSGTGVYQVGPNYFFDPAVAGVGTHTITYSLSNQTQAYWNFNSGSAGTPWNAPIAASFGTGNITAGNWIWGDIDYTAGFNGNVQNALFGDPAGASLSLIRGDSPSMNGRYIQVELSMTGLADLVISYWSQKSSNDGFDNNQWSYSTDGTNFTNFGSVINPSNGGSVYTISAPDALNGQPAVYLRYTLNGASTGASFDAVNNRLDNLQMNVASTCSTPCTFDITVNDLPTITGALEVCAGATTQLTGTGTPAVSNPWVSATPAVATVSNTGLVTGVAAGTSIITYTDINGCQQTATVTVYALPTISGATNVCVGSTTQLTGSGTPAATSPWVSSNTAVATVSATGLVTGVSNGTSLITYTDDLGCSQSVTVTVNALPVASATSNSPVCEGSTINLFGQPNGMTNYSWTGPNGWTSSGGSVTYSENFNSLASTGTSAVIPAGWVFAETGTGANTTYTAGNGSSPTGDTYSFGTTAGDRTLGGLLSGSLNPTIGASFLNSTGTLVQTVNIAYTGEQWRLGATGRIDRLDFQFSLNATSLTTGTWTNFDALDFTAPIVSGTVGALDGNTAPNRTIISSTITGLNLANGANFWIRFNDFNPTGADDGLGIDDFTIILGVASVQNPTIPNATPAMSGDYYLTVTDPNGCVSLPASTTVVVNPTSVGGTVASDATVCVGNNSGTLSLSGHTGNVVRWEYSIDGGVTWIPIANTTTTHSYTNLNQTTIFRAVVQSGACPVAYSTTATITMASAFNPGAHNTNTINQCQGYNPDILTFTTPPSGGILPYTYQWQLNGVNLPGETNASYDPPQLTLPGTYVYNCIVTDACVTSLPTPTKTIIIVPDPTVSVTGASAVCQNGPLTLTAVISNGVGSYNYIWRSGPTATGPWSTIGGATNVTYDPPTNVAGTIYYQVIISPASGSCNNATSAAVAVIVNALPTPTAASNSPVCVGSTLNLTGGPNGMTTYAWSGPNGFTSALQNPSIANVTLAADGLYTLTVTDANTCSAQATTTVVVNALPTPTAASNSPVCEGSTLNLTGGPNGMTTYAWTGPNGFTSALQNPSIANVTLAADGLYTLTVTDANTCSSQATTDVVINALPSPSASSNSPVCEGATLNLSGLPNGMTSYTWSGPDGFTSTDQNPSIINVTLAAAGTYTLTVADGNSCSAQATTDVVINALPTPSASSNSPVCEGATLNLSGLPNGMTSYTWSGPDGFTSTDQNPSIINVTLAAAGTYTLTVADGNSCSAQATTDVVINALPTPSASSNSPVCEGATLNLSGLPNGMTSYTWSGPDGFTSTDQNPSIINVNLAAAGTYTLTVADGNSCSAQATTDVVINALPSPSASSNSPVCEGATLNLSGLPNGMTSYTWSGPDGFTSTDQNPSIINVNLAAAGTYTLTVADGNSCSAQATTDVVINALPTPSASSNSPVCEGATLNLSGLPNGMTSYTWSGPDGFTSTDQNPSIINVTLAAAGTYTLTVADGNSCSAQATTDVVINALPSPSASSNSPVCEGATLNLSGLPNGMTSYTWSGPDGFTSTDQNPSIINVTLAAAGTYTLTVADGNSCSAQATTDVVINALPTPSASSNSPVCEGATLNLSGLPNGMTSYTWSGPDGFTSTDQNPSIINVTLAAAGTYTLTVADGNSCSAQATTDVVINALPSPSASSNSPVCEGATLNLSGLPNGMTSYTWSGPDGFTSTDQNPSIINVTLAAAGTYTLTVADGNSCSAQASTDVVINALPTPSASSNSPVCEGATLNLSGLPNGMTSYTWSGPDGFTSTDQNPSIINVTLAAAGTYTLTVADGNSCSAQATTDVVINALPTPSASSNSPVCEGATLNLSGLPNGMTSYTWSGPDGFTSTDQNPSIINVTLAAAGTYTLTVADGNSCSAQATTDVVINALPSPSASSNSPVCEGATLNLSGLPNGMTSYTWSGPDGFTSTDQNPSIINVTLAAAGTYTLTVVDGNSCSAQASTDVVINALPSPSASSNSPVCEGATLNLSGLPNGMTSYTWSGPDGFTSTDQNPSIINVTLAAAGTYTLTVADGNSCSAQATTDVVINALPTPSASSNSPVCEGATLNLSGLPNGMTSYTWSGPDGFTSTDQNPSIINVTLAAAGTYTLTVADGNSCSAQATTDVVINALPSPSASSNSPVCEGATLNLSGLPNGMTSYTWSGPDGFTSTDQNPSIINVTLAAAGTYTLTVADGNSCSAQATTDVVINALPTPSASSNSPVCEGATLNLSGLPNGMTSYTWSGPDGFTSTDQNPSIINVTLAAAGTYTLTVADGNSCSAQATTDVVINALPSPSASSNSPVCEGATLNLSGLPNGMTSYTWSGPDGFTSTDQNPSIINVTLAAAGTYTLTVADGNSCSAQASTDVVINALPTPSASSNSPVCEGATLNLSGLPNGMTSYTWSGPDGFTSTDQNPSIINVNLAAAGTYTLTVADGNSCSAQATTDVVINALPTPSASSNSPVCEGATLNLSGLPNGMTSYTWSGPDGFTSTDQNPSIINVTLAAAGTYTLTVADGNSCSAQATTDVVINALPSPSASSNSPVCEGATLNLSGLPNGMTSYTWSGPDGFTSTDQNPSIINVTLAAAGTYTLTVADGNSCSAQATTDVVINALPTAGITNNTGLTELTCLLTSISLTATGGGTYSWDDGTNIVGTDADLIVTLPGTYTVTVTDANGCIDTESILITQEAVTLVDVRSVANPVPTYYCNLGQAFTAINNGVYQGDITVRINGNTIEPVTAVLNATGTGSASYTVASIYPTVSGLSVTGNLDAPLILFNGADNVTIDGRFNGVRSLTIRNTSTGASASTILLDENATFNRVQFCNIEGSTTNPEGGVIYLGQSISTGTGNTNITINDNALTSSAAGRPANVIYSFGTAGRVNRDITITNNYIYNFLSQSQSSNGIYVGGLSAFWTIHDNRFYEGPGAFTASQDATYAIIRIHNIYPVNNDENFIISYNDIGGNEASETGTGMWTKTGFNTPFYGIYLDLNSSNTYASVYGNDVHNFNWSNSGAASWTGIHVENGMVSLGISPPPLTVKGNTIGSENETDNITLTAGASTPSGSGFIGINYESIVSGEMRSNIISGITTNNSNQDYSCNFYGIYKLATHNGYFTYSSNVIGSPTIPGSIKALSESRLNRQAVFGIYYRWDDIQYESTDFSVVQNTIANLVNNSINNNSQIAGIYVYTRRNLNITGNTIHHLTTRSAHNQDGASTSVIGIYGQFNIANENESEISDNTVYSLSNTSSAQTRVNGIIFRGSTQNQGNTIYRNFVYDLSVATSGSNNGTIVGIYLQDGTGTFANNIINLGSTVASRANIYGIYDRGGQSGTSYYYFNTLYLRGPTTTSDSYCLYVNLNTGTQRIINNIFQNDRLGSGINCPVRLSGNSATTINYNNYYASSGLIGRIGSTPYTALTGPTGWNIATGVADGDNRSINSDFANEIGSVPPQAIDLLPFNPDLGGDPTTGIINDYGLNLRGCDYTMGAWETKQVNVFASLGEAKGFYPTLKYAFDKINDGTHRGDINIEINCIFRDDNTAILNASLTGDADYTSVRVYPVETGIRVHGDINGPLILLNGADYVTFHGSVGGVGTSNDLTIENVRQDNLSGTFRFENGANNNSITFCTVKGAPLADNIGIITFAGGINDNNVISNNKLTCNTAGRPRNVILVSSASNESTTSTISDNQFYNFLRRRLNPANTLSNAIIMTGGSANWTISGNSFFEDTPDILTNVPTDPELAIIRIASTGNGFLVENNFIGGNSQGANGTWNKLPIFNVPGNNTFTAIHITTGTGTGNIVRGNVIRGFKWINSGAANWTGIHIARGTATIGGPDPGDGNIIGSAIAPSAPDQSSIRVTGGLPVAPATATAMFYGINDASPAISAARVIQRNTIGSITTNTSVTAASFGFAGIAKTSAVGPVNVTSDTIVNIQALSTSTGSDQHVYGIWYGNYTSGLVTIENDTISGLYNGSGGAGSNDSRLQAIRVEGSNTSIIRNNRIHGLISAFGNPSTGNLSSVAGIVATAGAQLDISRNLIFNLSNTTATGGMNVTGISVSGPSVNPGNVYRNFIHSLSVASHNPGAQVYGIRINYGKSLIAYNNIISLTTAAPTARTIIGIYDVGTVANDKTMLYYNTVYIGGQANISSSFSNNSYALWSSGGLNIKDYRNNVFYNARTNIAGTGRQSAIFFTDAPTGGITLNYNDYLASGVGGVLGHLAGTDYFTLPAPLGWQTAFTPAQDANSLSVNPVFNSIGLLFPDNPEYYKPAASLPSLFEISGIPDDYGLNLRNSPVTMGAWENDCNVVTTGIQHH
ncbi:MAG: beta strand repeat-containing protein [Lentimicrobium sp.]